MISQKVVKHPKIGPTAPPEFTWPKGIDMKPQLQKFKAGGS